MLCQELKVSEIYMITVKTSTYQGINLVLNIIKSAKKKEKVTEDLQLHSDRGFQYTSREYIYFHNNERIQLKTKLTPLEKRCQYVA